jgi:hypothetical protein
VPTASRWYGGPIPLPDAGIEVTELHLRHYLRPNPAMLKPDVRVAVVKDWAALPAPAAHRLCLALRHAGGGVECGIDGRYAGRVVPAGRLTAVQFTIEPGSALGRTTVDSAARPSGFVPVDLRPLARPGEFADAALTLAETATLKRVPFLD